MWFPEFSDNVKAKFLITVWSCKKPYPSEPQEGSNNCHTPGDYLILLIAGHERDLCIYKYYIINNTAIVHFV